MGPALAHKSARQGSGSVEGLRQCATIVCEPRQPIAARRTQQKFSDLFLRWEDVPSLLRNDPFANYARELDHMRARAGRGKMAEDEISKAGRQARFALWEKHGVDAIKHDLLNGGHRLVGGPPQVRELAWEWVRKKEAEEAAASVVRQVRTKEAEEAAAAASVVRQASPSFRSSKEASTPLPPPAPPRRESAETKPAEVFTLRPGIWGMHVDLKELWRRGREWVRQWRSRS
jgi:hypothetical protein